MRNLIFTLVASTGNFFTSVIERIANILIDINGEIGVFILNRIDKKRINYIRSVIEQHEEISELNVLNQINIVIEDAVNLGEWNENHQENLNIMANMLLNDHDWEENTIHSYITNIVNEADARMK